MMLFKLSKSSKVNRILVVSLSNIGDVVLTFPVIDRLRTDFPDAELHVLVGPKAFAFFDSNPHVARVVTYDKKMRWQQKISWLLDLRRYHFDLVVDLRNSFLPFLLNADVVTFPAAKTKRVHMKEKHFSRLCAVTGDTKVPAARISLFFSIRQQAAVERMLRQWREYVLIAPGAADQRKRWPEGSFQEVVGQIRSMGKNIVLVGDKADRAITADDVFSGETGLIDLRGETDLLELAGVVERAACVLTNDSGIMHLASYLNKPVVALFGPTDPFLYGPWSDRHVVLKKGLSMDSITVDDVMTAMRTFL